MTAQAIDAAPAQRGTLPLWVGLIIYGLLLSTGNRLLIDPDTFWQVAVGQWMVDHRAVPVTDVYSFTMQGQPWISTQWLAQVIFSQVYGWFGWAGLVALTALAIAVTYMLLTRFLVRYFGDTPVMMLLPASFIIGLPHFYARPHALALPVMVAWVAALLSAAERRQAPPFVLVLMMTLWANLHGGFVLGLMLIGPIALDAVLNVEAPARLRLLLRWFVFGLVALAASCITPYGWNSLLAARAILNLGEALTLIREWAPADFSFLGPLEAGALLIIVLAFLKGVKLPLMRTVLFVGLLYMALAHIRNADVFALLGPMVVAAPLAAQFGGRSDAGLTFPQPHGFATTLTAALMLGMTVTALAMGQYRPAENMSPVAAVQALKQLHAKRVFNDYDFGGYLISQGVAPYIDGRTELYGEKFVVEHSAARGLRNPASFFELLEKHKIDATLLRRKTPGAQLLDQIDGWRKVFADDDVVVHVRDANARHTAGPEIKPASN
ncbi:MAG: hypothetical protein ACRCTX_17310 [Afipia sp.]